MLDRLTPVEREQLLQLARVSGIKRTRHTLPAITRDVRRDRLPLSFAQQRLWFLSQIDSVSQAYHLAVAWRLTGALDCAALRWALDRIVARHDALRTTFTMVDEEPVQQIASAHDSRFALVEHDLRRHPDAASELTRLAAVERAAPFDLQGGPLVRGRLVQLDSDQHALLITMHHIVSDGWSMGVLVRELGALYAAAVRRQADPLPELEVQYGDYAQWQRRWMDGALLQQQADYWKKTLTGSPAVLELPLDHPRPAQQDFAGALKTFVLDESLTARLKRLSARHGTTLYMTLLAGWAALLARLSRHQDVVIGTGVANRGHAEIEPLIGFFVNTLALRFDVAPGLRVRDLLAQVKERTFAAQEHQDLPFEQVVELLQPARSASHSPLVQALFTWQNAADGTLELPGLTLGPLDLTSSRVAKFELMLALRDARPCLAGALEYATALFTASTIDRHIEYFRRLLQGMVADDEQTIETLPIVPESERQRLLRSGTGTESERSLTHGVHELFEAQAARAPDAPAIVVDGATLSYGELNRRANQLAHYLLELGVRPDTRVALCVEPGVEMMVGLLGVLKAGGAYVPLDPAYPVDRLRFMLHDCAPAVVLTQSRLREQTWGLDSTIPIIDLAARQAWSAQPETNSDPGRVAWRPNHLAYVIYTSGSTGSPKGVMVQHGSLANYAEAAGTFLSPQPANAVICSSIGFDLTYTTLYPPLIQGGCITIFASDVGDNIRRVADYLNALDGPSAHLLKLTPTHLQALIPLCRRNQNARLVTVVGGESLSRTIVDAWSRLFPSATVINHYGPTEATVGACTHRLLAAAASESIPIGRPIANARMYILDDRGDLVPEGVRGELYVGGAGVARGYVNRAGLTAQKFVPDPHGERGARMYRTGDLGRWLPDGSIEFLGRSDFQVKIRGFRIELGEIEARLAEHSGVREAAVIARDDGTDDRRLVAYYTSADDRTGIDAGELRAHLAATLPDYMLPGAYVHLDALPLAPNGKLDRKGLPAPEIDGVRSHEPPQGDIETHLAQIWADVLKVDQVGRDDNFFALGGHSLMAVRVVARVRHTLNIEISIRDLVAAPVLSDLAKVLDRGVEPTLPAITREAPRDRVPLSFAQQRLWFLAQMEGVSAAYQQTVGWRLKGALDHGALRWAFDRIIARHEALRTTFALVEDEPVQQIASADESRFALLVDDVRAHADAASELARIVAAERRSPFDLRTGPLIRGRLVHLADDEHALLIALHHIVSDGWSTGVLARELGVLYGAALERKPDPLPALTIQYGDYALWQRRWMQGALLQQQADYWRTTLAGCPTLLELPLDYPRPAQQDLAGAFTPLTLDAELIAGVKRLSARHGTTLYMTFLAGWAALLARLSGQSDVVIGSPMADRGRAEIEPLIGFFVSTVAVRLDVSPAMRVSDLLAQVKERTLAAQQHQDLPFEQVVELVQPVRSLAHSPLFQVAFAWQNAREGTLELPGLTLRPLRGTSPPTAKLELALSLQEDGECVVGGVEYATSLFTAPTIERYLAYFQRLLAAMVADEERPIDALPMLPEAEQRQLLEQWNATATTYSRERCLPALFEAQVARTPEAIAVVDETTTVSYALLNQRANQLAHYLRSVGVGPGACVALCLERTVDLVTALLGVLKAGGAYVPLDNEFPIERLNYILQDSGATVLLKDAHAPEALAVSTQIHVVDLARATAALSRLSSANLATTVERRHAAYVIYTSGSTGQPKGVVIPHEALANFLLSMKSRPGLSERDVWAAVTTVSFDIAALELYLPLLVGARIDLVPRAIVANGNALAAHLRACGATILQATPATWRLLVESGWAGMSGLRALCGGDDLPRQLADAVLERVAELWNLYGPTEATVWSTLERIERGPHPISIGRPIANTRIYLLNRDRQLVPPGVVGEIWIGGRGLALGYHNRPALTNACFVPDPFAEPDARMYRTGDLGRWLPEGTIQFLGRNDAQVKVRGFRIELGEIETQLRTYPGVRDAVVVARDEAPGERRLVAYYTAGLEAVPPAVALRAHLAATLPDYMLPAAYVRLDAVPLTPNGKLDRRALPAPAEDAYPVQAYAAPQGATETALAQIWAEVLKVERVGRHDNFFHLGGHSLLAVRVATRVRRALDLELAIRDLFVAPVLADLAELLTRAAPPTLPTITRAAVRQRVPLSFAQQRLWFLAQMEGVSAAYHIAIAWRLTGALDRGALGWALGRIVARHDALRTTFALVEDAPVQQIVAVDERALALVAHDLRGHADAAAHLARLIEEERRTPFDLQAGPLARGRLVQMADEEHVLLITLHHIVSDGWSMGVLGRELSALYAAAVRHEPDPFPALAIQYGDYAQWQRQWMDGALLQQQADYWRTTLAGCPTVLELPLGLPRPAQRDFAGAFSPLVLDPALTAGLRRLSARHGTTLYMTLLAGWAALLARLSGQSDVVIGSPVANRSRAEIEPLIGFFVNTLALRFDVAPGLRVRDLLAQVKERALAAQQHQDLPFEQIVELVQPVRSLAHSPLFQATFAWQNVAERTLDLPGLTIGPVGVASSPIAKFELMLSLRDAGACITGGAEYATSLFTAPTIERYLAYFQRLLAAMVADEERPIEALPMLPEAEQRQLLEQWNATATAYPRERCLPELFEAQVASAPHASAVALGDIELSYGEVNRRANQLAHYLRRQGVRPETRVAVCAERSVELLVGLLAVLKAGGAYVPLDPAYPAERLRFMLDDCAPAVVLTQAQLRERVAALAPPIPIVDLDAHHAWAAEPESDPDRVTVGLRPDHLAYVIYTSGSTGTPKGVMVPHRGLTNTLVHVQRQLAIGPDDVIAALASPAFDIALLEQLTAWLGGAQTRLISQSAVVDLGQLWEQLSSVTVLHAVPLVMTQLAQAWKRAGARLRTLLTGGDVVSAALVDTLRTRFPQCELRVLYGPTEASMICAHTDRGVLGVVGGGSPVGRPIGNMRIYILDRGGAPVPEGVRGELHIGGVGVARGYLNRRGLTAEKFVPDPYGGEAGARLYRTGDLGRWRPDGAIDFLGRIDFQVKIRGYRIELGEIEARLATHAGVREAVVVVRDDGAGDKRLVAYYTAADAGLPLDAERLRAHLAATLPDYMVPAAYVPLDALPLTPTGKLDRKALPAPGTDAHAAQCYEPPQGETETALAQIWAEVLKVERVGRHDDFFHLGGHSLLALLVIERLRHLGFHIDVRSIFEMPTLVDLAARVNPVGAAAIPEPVNGIPPGCDAITPAMLPLMTLSEDEIERIVSHVPGGAANVQDINPLTPLQEGMLFHHLMGDAADPYILAVQFSCDSRPRLDSHLRALQTVVDRNDFLRTAVHWEGLSEPVQVVYRRAPLVVEEVTFDSSQGDEVAAQMYARFHPRQVRIDLRCAPLMRLYAAYDPQNGRWLLMHLLHHLVGDHRTFELMLSEVHARLVGDEALLPAALPSPRVVSRASRTIRQQEHETFFRQMLADVTETTAPFGLLDVHSDGTGIEEGRIELEPDIAARLRASAARLGVSAASVCHVAWAQVLARTSGRDDVVFGTVLFGRTQGKGADRAMGLLINTLPVRLDTGAERARGGVRTMHTLLTNLLRHEHASLALAQRCSAVHPPAPLFSALLNYRHSASAPKAAPRPGAEGLRVLRAEERSNYPLALSVEDRGTGFGLTAQAPSSVGPRRVCEYMRTALVSLVDALESSPETPLCQLTVLPEAERRQVVEEWNATVSAEGEGRGVPELFEAQVARAPAAVAVALEDLTLSYGEVNRRANQLAHYLRRQGVRPETRVAVCAERSVELLVGLLAVLKAGGAYVPLDPAYPAERLRFMLDDCAPAVVLTQAQLRERVAALAPPIPIVDLDAHHAWAAEPESDPDRVTVGLRPDHLAYVIYTSGSTGTPKGVMVPHRGLTNTLVHVQRQLAIGPDDVIAALASPAFDIALLEQLTAWLGGAQTRLISQSAVVDLGQLWEQLSSVTVLHAVPLVMTQLAQAWKRAGARLRTLLTGGDVVSAALVDTLRTRFPQCELRVLYGPTEAAMICAHTERGVPGGGSGGSPVGRPIGQMRLYLLDEHGAPVPVGVSGELYIGGVGVARGYLHRPGLTAEKFVPDPFGGGPGARVYRTGDRGRWRADGTIEFLGRTDFQVKIRGFRIELGEIEARLAAHAGVRQAVVVARDAGADDTRLVAYYTAATAGEPVDADRLRAHVAATLPDYMVPAAYVALDAWPRTPHGKLDRHALPAPATDAHAVRGYEPPQGETETALAQIWAEVLKVERVGRHDDFFHLGGHSLLILNLVNALARVHITIAVHDVFSYSTLSSLAAYVQRHRLPTVVNQPLLVRDSQAGPPLFVVHEGAGTIAYVHSLARYVDEEIAVYALPPRAAGDAPSISIQQMATRMVGMIQSVQPLGPYRVAGWSFGGVLAFEIARQLLSLDQRVTFVGLLDSVYPGGLKNPRAPGDDTFDEKRYLLVALEPFNQDVAHRLVVDAMKASAPSLTFEALVERCRRAGILPPFYETATIEQIRHQIVVMHENSTAFSSYIAAPMPTAVHLFKSETEFEGDALLGWDSILPDSLLTVVRVQGTHASMMTQPQVKSLGRAMSKAIAASGTSLAVPQLL